MIQLTRELRHSEIMVVHGGYYSAGEAANACTTYPIFVADNGPFYEVFERSYGDGGLWYYVVGVDGFDASCYDIGYGS